MTTDQLFRRARQMLAQSPTPTTLTAQLAILARRGRQPKRVARVEVHAWQRRADLQ